MLTKAGWDLYLRVAVDDELRMSRVGPYQAACNRCGAVCSMPAQTAIEAVQKAVDYAQWITRDGRLYCWDCAVATATDPMPVQSPRA